MKRGVGLKFQAVKLTSERLQGWLFDNVGEVQTRTSGGSLICASHDDGVYVTWNAGKGVLRIALWTELTEDQAWPIINDWAKRVAGECQCELTTWAMDLYEYDEATRGHVCKYDALVPGEILEKIACAPVVTKKAMVH